MLEWESAGYFGCRGLPRGEGREDASGNVRIWCMHCNKVSMSVIVAGGVGQEHPQCLLVLSSGLLSMIAAEVYLEILAAERTLHTLGILSSLLLCFPPTQPSPVIC